MNKNETHQTAYWHSFDFIKGLLILCVFMGHIIPGEIHEIFPRYAVYSFHMPLFIGISGFLFHIEKIDMRLHKLFVKYWKRLGFPWVIAVISYYIINDILILNRKATITDFLSSFVYPYYHLWYVLGFISYLLITCFLWTVFKKNKYKWIFILVSASIISIISRWELLYDVFQSNAYLKLLDKCVQYDFRLYNLIFFIIGVYCRNKYENNQTILSGKKMEILRPLMILSILMVTFLFFFEHQNTEYVMFYVMNILILLITIHDCVNSLMPGSFVLEFIGKYSLPFYLYHIFCKLLSKELFTIGSELYYAACVISFILVFVLIFFLRKIPFFNKIIFGTTKSGI